MFQFLIPTNIFQLISNLGIFALIIFCLFMFRRIKIGKDGIEVERDSTGSKITLKTIHDKICAIEETDKIQSLDLLRINFYLQRQPEETKLVSGLRYLKQKGNGRTRSDIYDFVNSHKELYKTIIALEPDLEMKACETNKNL